MAAREGDQREKRAATRRAGHPLLRGLRRDKYTHGLHPAEMDALRAMCGALIPSLPPEEGLHGDGDGDDCRGDPHGGKDLERFYLASGADSTVPDEVAELTVTRCVWEAVALVRVVLWVLSTRAGTLALCGRLCVSGELPYVRRFADMPVERREEALKRWNRARWLFPLRIAVAVVKIISHFAFYTTKSGGTGRLYVGSMVIAGMPMLVTIPNSIVCFWSCFGQLDVLQGRIEHMG